jgi:hypothetical protein
MRTKKIAAMFAVGALAVATPAAAAQPVNIQSISSVFGRTNGTAFPFAAFSGAPLLVRFNHTFNDGDHHIRQIAAMPLPQQSAEEVSFADENGDDSFTYDVAHEGVDPTGVVQSSFHGRCAGSCTVPLGTRPPGDFVFVLSGFRVTFDNGDHHLDQLAITEFNGFLTTVFKDENGDDLFTYDVSYAWVPTSRLTLVDEVSGTVVGRGSATVNRFTGEKVIRGFSVDNTRTSGEGQDNHIRDLGVIVNSSGIVVRYSDVDPVNSAPWSYRVQYAALR